MIQTYEVPDDEAFYDIVDADELPARQQQGWRCIRLVPEQVAVVVPMLVDGVPDSYSSGGHFNYVDEHGRSQSAYAPPGKHLATERHVIWRARFLMRKGRDRAMEELRERADANGKRAVDAEMQLAEAERQKKAWDETMRELEAARDEAENLADTRRGDYHRIQRAHDALERDLGKLRRAFGSVAVKKALGAED